jgi:hypothetical protein
VQARPRRGDGSTPGHPLVRRGNSYAGWDSPVWARSLPELAMKRKLASARRAPPTDASPRFREESRDFRGGSPRGAHRPRGAR